MTPEEQIKTFRDHGISNERIADYYRTKFSEKQVVNERIDAWLTSKGLTDFMNIKEIREKNPEYSGLSDYDLSKKLHTKFYNDMPFDEFTRKIGADVDVIKKTSFLDSAKEWIGKARGTGRNVGGMLGGAGAVALTKNPVMAVPGAAWAGALGEGVEQELFKALDIPTEVPIPDDAIGSLKNMGNAAIEQGLGESLGMLGGPLVGKLSKPLTREAELAAKNNLPISPSSIGGGKQAKMLEFIGESLPTGKVWVQHKRKQLSDSLIKMAEDVKDKIPIRTDQFNAGVGLAEGIKQGAKNLHAKSKAGYDAFYDSMGSGMVPMNKTWETVDNLILTKAKDLNQEQRAFLEAFRGKSATWSVDDVNDFQKSLSNKFFKKSPDKWKTLTNALKEDIGEEPLARLEAARKDWQDFKTFNANPTVKAIKQKYRQEPDKVIFAAFKSGNIEDINTIKKAVDPEVFNTAAGGFVENIMDTCTRVEGPNVIFEPLKFVRNFEKYGRQIENVMPDIYSNMEDFYVMTKASIPDIKKSNMGSFEKGWQVLAGTAMIGGATQTPLIVVPATFSAIVAKSVMNPKGYMKKYLTEGVSEETSKLGLRVGGRAAIPQTEERKRD